VKSRREKPDDWSKPDFSREKPHRAWHPDRKLLKAIRNYQRLIGKGGLASLKRPFIVLRHRFWSAVSGADIPLNAQIEGGLHIPHPNGIVIHPKAKIGPNCLILQQVTLGVVTGKEGAPELGFHVDVGAGAKILGPVKIGDGAKIGANAVVLCDVPAGAVAVGVPAKILPRSSAPAGADVSA
jgi:serine O-acetyltransferase